MVLCYSWYFTWCDAITGDLHKGQYCIWVCISVAGINGFLHVQISWDTCIICTNREVPASQNYGIPEGLDNYKKQCDKKCGLNTLKLSKVQNPAQTKNFSIQLTYSLCPLPAPFLKCLRQNWSSHLLTFSLLREKCRS